MTAIIAGMPERFRILITNDDGVSARGLLRLSQALADLGQCWVVAPETEQSAVSHALTLERPLRLRQLGERHFSVNGTPTDCVTLAMSCLMKDRLPDVVVSGINRGANMGVDVHYSGTVSAAFEGVILGSPAVAVSQVIGNGVDLTEAGRVAREITSWVLEHGLPPQTLLNINVPSSRPRGLRLTRLGVRRYTEGVLRQKDPRGKTIYWIGGGRPVWERIPGTDFNEVGNGWISVTPLHLDMTSAGFLSGLKENPPPWVRGFDDD